MHLVYSMWPERVEKTCETDRPIAIANDFEQLFKVDAPKAKKPRKCKGKKTTDVEEKQLATLEEE